jgi:cytochrome c oxidase assembly factor CtaG
MSHVRAKERVAFLGGLVLAVLALVPPLGHYAGLYIWVRSIQDLLLAFAAPALIVLGAPWKVWARGRPAERAGRRRWPAWPVAVVLTFNVVWLGWHVTAAYDLAATNPAVRYLEYVSYLAAGIGFWRQLIGSRPALPPMRRLALLVGTAAADTVLGMVLVFGSAVVYPAYRGAGHHALSVLSDQQVADHRGARGDQRLAGRRGVRRAVARPGPGAGPGARDARAAEAGLARPVRLPAAHDLMTTRRLACLV